MDLNVGGGPPSAGSSGDDVLDALVRDLSARVDATDGAWVREQAGSGPSIYEDFEGALRRAPRLVEDGEDEPLESAETTRAMAAMMKALSGSDDGAGFRVVDLADLTDLGAEGAALQKAGDELVEKMLAMSASKGEATGRSSASGADAHAVDQSTLRTSLAELGFDLVGVEAGSAGATSGGGPGGDSDAELKGLMAQLSSQLKAGKREVEGVTRGGHCAGTVDDGAEAATASDTLEDEFASLGYTLVDAGGVGSALEEDDGMKELLARLAGEVRADVEAAKKAAE